MKDLTIRIICIISIFAVLMSYNTVLAMRAKDEQIVELQNQISSLRAGSGTADDPGGSGTGQGYKDGTYTGSAEGYGGQITMKVVIKNGSISDITAVSHDGEDAAYWDMAVGVIPEMTKSQTSDVDSVGGATFSSVGIINAVTDALSKAI